MCQLSLIIFISHIQFSYQHPRVHSQGGIKSVDQESKWQTNCIVKKEQFYPNFCASFQLNVISQARRGKWLASFNSSYNSAYNIQKQ